MGISLGYALDNPYFEQINDRQKYPTELQLKEANSLIRKPPFKTANDIVSSKIYDNRVDLKFETY